MNCTEVNALLDQLMDGTLSASEKQALEAHGQTCPECAGRVRSALQMKALFDEMEAEADVPLTAQAAWRGAVRAEAARAKRLRMRRLVGVAAAAVVLVGGIGWALNARVPAVRDSNARLLAVSDSAEETTVYDAGADGGAMLQDAAPMSEAALDAAPAIFADSETADFMAAGSAMIESDGQAEADSANAISAAGAPMHEVRVRVPDLDAACGYICDLVAEYEGRAEEQRFGDDDAPGAGANIYVEIPAENAAELVSAIAQWNAEGETGALTDVGGEGSASLLLVVSAE